MSEWKEYKLGYLISNGSAELQTGPFGTMLSASEYSPQGIPVIAVQDIGDNKLIHKKFVFVNSDVVKRLSRYRVKEHDIIFGRKGAVDRRALIKKSEEGWLQGSDCIRLRFTKDICPQFVSYQLGSKTYKDWMLQNATGATMPSLNQDVLSQLPIRLPLLHEQQNIASTLSSIDDKIDLLNRQNTTLEALAVTLFRQWFVEEAKEEWEAVKLGDYIHPKKGKNITKAEAVNGEFPVVAGGLEPSCYHNDANTGAPVITVSASGANAGHVRLYHTSVWSSDSSYIDSSVTQYVYFFYVFLRLNQNLIYDKQEGSAQPHVYPSHLMDLDMLQYPPCLIEHFETTSSRLFLKIKNNFSQIRTLTALRDTVLPKLMNGEVRVNK
jgi:type I restriction enzyme, S subunit